MEPELLQQQGWVPNPPFLLEETLRSSFPEESHRIPLDKSLQGKSQVWVITLWYEAFT